MNYGIPYMGSKSKICENICPLFPKSDNFYDLFGGGFSVTHFMLKHRKNDFKEFHFNELRPGVCDLIKDAIDGKYSYKNFKPRWISREEFLLKKETNPYIKIIWSFGNNGGEYLFGKDIEHKKKSMHMAIVFNEFDSYAKEIFGIDKFKEGYGVNEKRLYLKNRLRLLNNSRLDIQQLERLQQLERPNFYTGSYEDVPIKENSVIYCDIPYFGTSDYGKVFSHKDFFNWAHEQKEPVYISEYMIRDNRFKCVANFKKRVNLSDTKTNLVKTEKVYVNVAGYKKLFNKI